MRIRNVIIIAFLLFVAVQIVVAQQNSLQPTGTSTMVMMSGAPSSGDAVFEGNPVKNAPYSAEAISQNTTVLADGNRIVKSSTTKLFRDSEGRTRRESSVENSPITVSLVATPFGSAPNAALISPSQIQISDPISGIRYLMDPQTHTVRKIKAIPMETHFVLPTQIPAAYVPPESLGTKSIEGLECEGTRTSSTIPAGQIGNEKDILITNERWYSPKLQTDVLVKRFDPRSGENIYKLVNVNQAEPSAALFQVPADYTIEDLAEKAKEMLKETRK